MQQPSGSTDAALAIIASIALCGGSDARAGVPEGLAWLRTEQLPDGTWASKPRLQLGDSAEVILAFDVLSPNDATSARNEGCRPHTEAE